MEASPHFSTPEPDEMAGGANSPVAQIINLVRRRASPQEGVLDYDQIHGRVVLPGSSQETAWTLNVPHALASPLIHVIYPGFGGFKRSSRGLRNALSTEEQYACLSYEPVRESGSRKQDFLDAQRVHKDTAPAILEEIMASEELNNTTSGHLLSRQRIGLIAHSMGGIPAAEQAINRPEETAYLINLATVGLTKKVGLEYIPRVIQSGRHEIIPAIASGAFGGWRNTPKIAQCALRYYGSNFCRTAGEIKSLFEVDLRPHLAAIGALGVELSFIAFENDKLIIPGSSLHEAKKLNFKQTELMRGLDHLAPQTHPLEVALAIGQHARLLANKQPTATAIKQAA